MRLSRRVRVTCLAAITGLGVPLLVSGTSGSLPAAGAELHPVHLYRNGQQLMNAEKRREKPGYLQARAAYFDARRLSGDKPLDVTRAAHLRAVAAAERTALSSSSAASRRLTPSFARAASASTWKQIPKKTTLSLGYTTGQLQPVSGRISALAVDSSGRIFAGAAQGGVWRYAPKAQTWTPLTDHLDTLAVGALAIAPSDQKTIYLGSGEGDLSGDSYWGNGVYRSTDGGNTWSHVNGSAKFVGASISKIVVDPKDPKRLYAATIRGKAGSFRVLSPFQDTWGVYRSNDGGHHWKLLKGTHKHARGATDLALDPRHPRQVYATFLGKGIFRTKPHSHQSGWTRIMDGLPDGDFGAKNDESRFAISASRDGNQTRLYTGFDWLDHNGVHHDSRVFRSNNGGASWHKLPTEGPLPQVDSVRNYCDIQCTYDNVVTADPDDPDTVYVAGEYNYPLGTGGIYRSTDGGKTWKNLGLDLHPDFHAVALEPGHSKHVVIGNDGGVWDSSDAGGRLHNGGLGAAHWNNLNVGIDITQMDSIAYSDHPPFEDVTGPVYYSGTQDNGTQLGPLGSSGSTWVDIGSGDGGVVLVDPNKPQYVFGTFYGISPYRFDDAGGVTADGGIDILGQLPIDNGINPNDRSEFYVPWVQNQVDSNQLFLGTYRVYRTNNAEADDAGDVTWKPISRDLTTGCHGEAYNTGRGCLISAVGLSEGGTGVYAGTEEGLVWSSPDGTTAAHPTWNERDYGLPGRPVSAFAVDRSDWRTAYAAFAGYGVTTPYARGHVYKTTDGGQTWTNVSGVSGSRLPDNPVNDLVLDPSDPDTLFAGTDVGAFVTHDGGHTWQELGTSMPTVAIFSLKWNPARAQLVAGTHGRGGWVMDTELERPALVVSVDDSGKPVGPGTPLDYAVTVRNIGNAAALGAEVTQQVPAHTTFASASDGGTFANGAVHWTIPEIPAGGSVTVHYSVTISDHLASGVTSIDSDGLDVTATDAQGQTYTAHGSPQTTPIAPPNDVTLAPASQEDGARVGQPVDFPVTVTNSGYRTDSFDLSTDQHWDTTVLDAGCSSPRTTTGALAPGDSVTVCVRVDVPADALDGDRDTQVLTATSTGDPTVQGTAEVVAIAVAKDTLLVDESGGVPGAADVYASALKAAGIPFGTWDLSQHEVLPAGFLNAHAHVYWLTGPSWPGPLLKYEDLLSGYLDNGHDLFISGLDVLDQAAGTTDFVHDYLHVDWDGTENQNDVPTDSVHGVNGSAIGDGVGTVPLDHVYGPFEDELTLLDPAAPQFTDDNSEPDALAVTDTSAATSNQYRVVFLAFALESYGGAADRTQLISRVQDYFTH